MGWFANRGQVIQIGLQVTAIIGGSAMLAALAAIAQKITSVSLDWWVIGAVFFGSALLLWWGQVAARGAKPQAVGVSPLPVSSPKPQRTVPIIGLVVERSWLEPAPDATYKMKLRIVWGNEGDHVHVGKPRWIPKGIGIQGNTLGHYFQLQTGEPETLEVDIRPGHQCRLWVGLDHTVNIAEVRRLHEARQLGVIVLPLRASGQEIELRVRV